MNDSSEMNSICEVLGKSTTIAVVGLSNNPNRTSYEIAQFLVNKGFKVVGVNPTITNAGSIEVFPNLTSIPFAIDIVDVFRRSETIDEIIEDVLKVKPKCLWLQQGVRNDVAVKPVLDAGIFTIQDKCIAVYYNLCKACNS